MIILLPFISLLFIFLPQDNQIKQVETPTIAVKPSPTTSPTLTPEPTKKPVLATPTPLQAPSNIYIGKVSYYSRGGCLGCSGDLRTGSGEPLDDSRLTLAIPCENVGIIKYGTMARVTNLDNGLSVEVTINDCGGFTRHGRIADLSLATYNALEAKTDQSNIKLEIL